MKRAYILMLSTVLVVLFCTGTGVAISTSSPLAGHFDLWINSLTWGSVDGFCSQDDKIAVEFEVTAGEGVMFFVCDEWNYSLWADGRPAYIYCAYDNVSALSTDFVIPCDGTWYAVFYNSGQSSVHVVGSINYESSRAVQTTVAVFLALSVLAAVLGAVFLYVRRSGPNPYIQPVSPSSFEASPASSPGYRSRDYCPFCGSPKIAPQDRFCRSCGRLLEQ
ncbi:MAG: hypothetical protein QXS20_03545 [Candidatus Thorarchaeota archaeon]